MLSLDDGPTRPNLGSTLFGSDTSIYSVLGWISHATWWLGWLECSMNHRSKLFESKFLVVRLGSMYLCVYPECAVCRDVSRIQCQKLFLVYQRKDERLLHISRKLNLGFCLVDVLSSGSAALGGSQLHFFVPDIFDKSIYFGFAISIGHGRNRVLGEEDSKIWLGIGYYWSDEISLLRWSDIYFLGFISKNNSRSFFQRYESQ